MNGKTNQIIFQGKEQQFYYLIDLNILQLYPGSVFYEEYKKSSHETDVIVQLQTSEEYLDLIVSYLKNEMINWSVYDGNQLKCIEEAFHECGLPIPVRLSRSLQKYQNIVVETPKENDYEMKYKELLQKYNQLNADYESLQQEGQNHLNEKNLGLKSSPSSSISALVNKYKSEYEDSRRSTTIYQQYYNELHSLSLLDKPWRLLFKYFCPSYEWFWFNRASENDFSSHRFHEICDDCGSLLILIRVYNPDQIECIFGGYSSIGYSTKDRQLLFFRI